MRSVDTIDKIVGVYLAGVTRERFQYKRHVFEPKPVVVSKNIFKKFKCNIHCGACCGNFSLDYLKDEERTISGTTRSVDINGSDASLVTDYQVGNRTDFCVYLNRENGLCKIQNTKPFACDFEPIRFLHYRDRVLITSKIFGRFWAMKRLDGEKGTLCEFGDPDTSCIVDVRRKLERLQRWAVAFNIRTCVGEIIEWTISGDINRDLIVKCDTTCVAISTLLYASPDN